MCQDLPTDMTTTMAAMTSQSNQEIGTKRRAMWYSFQKVKLIKTLSELNTPKYWSRNGWNEEAWEIVKKRMQDSGYCFDYSIKQIKNQERALKNQYDTVKKLTRLNGFHWDKCCGKVIALDDLWKQLFESEKRAQEWHRMQFPLYEELCKLYEGTNFKQKCAQCAITASEQSSVCSYTPPPKLLPEIQQSDQSTSSTDESSDTDYSTDSKDEIPKMIPLQEVIRKPMINDIWWLELAGTKTEKPQKENSEKYSISECMKALNGSSGFSPEERLKAANFLEGRIRHDFLPEK